MKKFGVLIILSILTTLFAADAGAHCQIPCGIYDDDTRITLLNEHATTIEKAMRQINEISKSRRGNKHQMIRWVNNKEKHAQMIQQEVLDYFLAQRIKLTDPANEGAHAKYVKMLTALHKVVVEAMKCKQTTDLKHVEALRLHLHNFAHLYLEKTKPGS